MAQYIEIDPYRLSPRTLNPVLEGLKKGSVIAYPTDSGYALGCCLRQKKAILKLKKIRDLDKDHHFTLLCRDLSDIAEYAKVDNPSYRFLKRNTPGGCTFILPATQKVPELMQHKSKKTIGIRISDHMVTQKLLEYLGEPLISTTMILPGETDVLLEASQIDRHLGHVIDFILDSEMVGHNETTLIDMTEMPPAILRQGLQEVLTKL